MHWRPIHIMCFHCKLLLHVLPLHVLLRVELGTEIRLQGLTPLEDQESILTWAMQSMHAGSNDRC